MRFRPDLDHFHCTSGEGQDTKDDLSQAVDRTLLVLVVAAREDCLA